MNHQNLIRFLYDDFPHAASRIQQYNLKLGDFVSIFDYGDELFYYFIACIVLSVIPL